MVVTTIDLLNYLRCRRYAALDTLLQARQSAGIPPEDKYSALKILFARDPSSSSLEEEDPENLRQKQQMHHELTGKAVYGMRMAAEPRIRALFPEMLLAKTQKVALPFGEDVVLSVRLDFLGSYSDSLFAFVILPVSDRDLIHSKFNVGKVKIPFFVKNEQGVYSHDRPSASSLSRGNFEERLARMTDRRNDTGRMFYDLAFKDFVLHRSYPDQTVRTFLVLLNADYVLPDSPSADPDPSLVSLFETTPFVEKGRETIEVDLYRMLNHIRLNDDSPCPLVKNECQRGGSFECQFADYCFQHVPRDNSVFAYFQQHLGFAEGPSKTDPVHDTYDLVNEGRVGMLDVPISWLQREKNLMQRYCVENDYTFVNKPKIKALLETLRYPLYYLDFEAYPSILPRFRGESPYSQSVFQFSVFVENAPGSLDPANPSTHREFLVRDGEDHREELVVSLLSAIPPGDTPIVVYNQTFEKNRLLELAALFPRHSARLEELAGRLFDLLHVLKTDFDFYVSRGFSREVADSYNFYDPRMSGSYSLKKVLPVFDGKGYSGMPIGDGMTAYLQYARFPGMERAEREKTARDLLAYCGQDTWSMAVILHGLQNLL